MNSCRLSNINRLPLQFLGRTFPLRMRRNEQPTASTNRRSENSQPETRYVEHCGFITDDLFFSLVLSVVDLLYADVLIPFSYVTSTVYKQDVQIKPQYPESIIRIEVGRVLVKVNVSFECFYRPIPSVPDKSGWHLIVRANIAVDYFSLAQNKIERPSFFSSSLCDSETWRLNNRHSLLLSLGLTHQTIHLSTSEAL